MFSGVVSFIALNRALEIFLAVLVLAIVFAAGYLLSESTRRDSNEVQKLLAAEIAHLKAQIAKLKRKL